MDNEKTGGENNQEDLGEEDEDIKCQKTSRKIKLIKRRLFLKQEEFQDFSSRNIMKIKLIKRKLYKVKEDVHQKMKATLTPLVRDMLEAVFGEQIKGREDQKSSKLCSTRCGVCKQCNRSNCGQCRKPKKKTKENHKDVEWIGDGVDGGKRKARAPRTVEFQAGLAKGRAGISD